MLLGERKGSREKGVRSTGYPGSIDRGLWMNYHRALLTLVVSRCTRLYISRSSRMSFAILSTA